MRKKEGVTFSKCGSQYYYWQISILPFQCKRYSTRKTLRSGGTILQDGKPPFRNWFICNDDKIVELDEGFNKSVETDKSPDERKREKRKRERDSQKKSAGLVMARTINHFDQAGKQNKSTKFRFAQMVVM